MTRQALESESFRPQMPEFSGNVFADPSFSSSFENVPTRQASQPTGDLLLDSPYPQTAQPTDASVPLISEGLKAEIGKADSIGFSTAAENSASGTTPDYRVVTGEDGKLVLEKIGDGDPLADGKLNIEVAAKDNESVAEAIKQADQNLKEYIREMMQYWQQNHPGKPMPGWWTDILSSQPNIPPNAQPVESRPATVAQSQPQQADAPQQRSDVPSSQPRSSGGSSGGSGSGGSGGSSGGGGGGGGSRGGGGDRGGYRSGDSGPSPTGDVGPDVSLNDKAPVAMQIMDYFIEKGLTKEQAAGIVGNLQRESGLDPGVEEKGNGIGYGLAQWSFGRRDNLEAYSREQGKPVSDLKLQLDFMWKEMNTTESATLQAFKANPNMSASEAAAVFESKFERAGIVALGERQGAANQYLAMYENGGANGATAVARTDAPANIEGAPARIATNMIDGQGVLKPQYAIDTGIDGNYSQSMQTRDVVLAPGAAQAFKAAFEEGQASGVTIAVNSSFRDADGQERVDSGGNPKAPVGHSAHNKGNAVDIANASDPTVERIMNKHGFVRDVAGDEPHYTYQPGKRAVPNSLNA